MTESTFERVIVNGAVEFFFGAVFLDICHQRTGKVECLAGAGVEVDFNLFKVDASENCCNSILGRFLQVESQGIHTLLKHVEGNFVCLGGVSGENLLTGKPMVVVTGSAHIGELTGKGIRGLEFCNILTLVHRLDIEALVSAPHQFFLKGYTLEVGIHLRAPCFIAHGRKLSEQFFFVICHG